MIKIENLSKAFGKKVAVNIDNLSIAKGETIGIVGNNGAGKTTLFRLMLDLCQATTGVVLNQGQNVAESEDWKSTTGAYIDNGFLIDFLTPEEYFDFIGNTRGLDSSEISFRLEQFERFMNDEVLGYKEYIRNFSSGNKQKIGIIGAMLVRPDILILDEPFNFLDPSSQIEIKRLLKLYNAEYGTTIIISSHNLDHIVDVSNRIMLMENGAIIKDIANANGEAVDVLNNYFDIK